MGWCADTAQVRQDAWPPRVHIPVVAQGLAPRLASYSAFVFRVYTSSDCNHFCRFIISSPFVIQQSNASSAMAMGEHGMVQVTLGFRPVGVATKIMR